MRNRRGGAPAERPRRRPSCELLVAALDEAEVALRPYVTAPDASGISAVAQRVAEIERALRGTVGTSALLADPVALAALEHRAASLTRTLAAIEAAPRRRRALDGAEIEALNAALDRVQGRAVGAPHATACGTARAVEDLAGGASRRRARSRRSTRSRSRCRRSTGSRCAAATPPACTCSSPATVSISPTRRSRASIATRRADPLFTAGAVRVADGHLAFVYKTAAEIGELGDNTARLRAQIRDDELLRLAVRADTAEAVVLAHTRWASVGIISEANAHPLNQEELGGDRDDAYVVAALNGDVDNYADLKALEALRFPAEITTDAKVIPALVSRRIASGAELDRGVPRRPSPSFEGSVAIAAQSRPNPAGCCSRSGAAGRRCTSASPTTRSSSRASRTASSRSATATSASTARRCSMPGEPGDARVRSWWSTARAGDRRRHRAAVVRRARAAGRRRASCSTPRSRRATSTAATRRTTSSRRSTKRPRRSARRCAADRRATTAGSTCASPPETLPARSARPAAQRRRCGECSSSARARPRSPGQSLALALRERARPAGPITVEAVAATELSGFGLAADMSDTLVVAISQSGTTTDTNRTVDLARARGAAVIAHRQSPPERPRRQERRRALHLRRPRRRDERRVDQGVLRADRGRASCSRSRLAAELGADDDDRPRRTATSCSARCASCPTRCARCSSGGPAIARRRAAPRVDAAARGRSSATASTGSRRKRCGSSSRSSVTSRSRATSPRTRSTSTSRPSR